MNANNVTPISEATPDVTVSLANTTVLVKVTSTEWTANKRDKKASLQVAKANNVVNKRAARVNKSLLPDSKIHSDITSLIGEARRTVESMTLPWSDGGERILNIALLPKFMETMEEYEANFNNMVDILCAELNNEIVKASFTMGDLYDRDDYPNEHEIRQKYNFKFIVTPLPTTADFRVDMPADMANKVKGAYQRAGDHRVEQALSDAWKRIHKKLAQLIDRLTDEEDGKRKRFGNGLLESAHELVDTLQFLNVSGDFELEQARIALKQALRGLTTEQVKESIVARMEVTENLQAVQAKFDSLSL